MHFQNKNKIGGFSLHVIRTLCWQNIVHKTVTNLIPMMYSGPLFFSGMLYLEELNLMLDQNNSINEHIQISDILVHTLF